MRGWRHRDLDTASSASIRSGENGSDRLDHLGVKPAVGGDHATVLGERGAAREIERSAGDVGDHTARLFDDELAGRVIPDLLAVVGPGRQAHTRLLGQRSRQR